MAYITCKDLCVGYEGEAVAENINFELEAGDYLCVVGENGAGKSTLMKTLLHLTKPISGDILYSDNITPYEVGYLPQQTPVQMDFPASVEEIVLSGTLSRKKFKPFYSKEDKAVAKDNMKKMDIWDLRKSSFRFLSGGQKQRVLLARALSASEKLLVLDEPVSGLDPKVTTEFYQLIKQLNDDGLSIIMVSHDMHEGLENAKHILHIGREHIFWGTKDDYFKSEAAEAFLGISGE